MITIEVERWAGPCDGCERKVGAILRLTTTEEWGSITTKTYRNLCSSCLAKISKAAETTLYQFDHEGEVSQRRLVL